MLQLRVHLHKHDRLVIPQVLEIVPLMPGIVVQSGVLVEAIGEYNVLRNQVGPIVNRATVTQSQGPVVTRALKRFPYAALNVAKSVTV